MGINLNPFTWWNGATLGARITIGRRAVEVGQDETGNRYFLARDDKESYDKGRRRRYVIYKGYAVITHEGTGIVGNVATVYRLTLPEWEG